jgi:microcystin-dependent protein
LFAAIGTTYGSGDGSTTFNLPDLRGRSAFGVDNMGGTSANRITTSGSGIDGTTLGANGGFETITLTVSQIPSHKHGIGLGTSNINAGLDRLANVTSTVNYTNIESGVMQNTGGDQPHNNMTPAIILNYIIKT